MTLEDPIRAIREISHDLTCRRGCAWPTAARLSAFDIQREYLERAMRYAERRGLSPAGGAGARRCGSTAWTGIEKDPLSLDRECDWVIKHRLVEAYRARHDLPLGAPAGGPAGPAVPRRRPQPGHLLPLQARGRWSGSTTDEAITEAMDDAPADDPGPPAGRVHQ